MAEKIVIDAGHNGLTDPGAVFNGRRESDDVLRLARAVGDILARNGYDIDYTRTGDIAQTVVQKAQYANNAGADLFVSLHRNMATYPEQYNGVQTLVYDRSGIKVPMAENINSNLEGVGFRNINVDVRPDLAVLRRTAMPALLVEVGFIDSERDNQLFDTRFDEIAQAIADGIMDTLNTEGTGMSSAPSMGSVSGMASASSSGAASGMSAIPSMGTASGMGSASGSGMTSGADAPARYAFQDPMQMDPTMLPSRPEAPMPPMWSPFQQDMDAQQSNASNLRPLYRVQVGAFYNLQNAIELEQELKRMGYNTWIVTV